MSKFMTALIGMAIVSLPGLVAAKLPPLSPEAQATAAETKNKTAWSDKVAAYKLCLVQDKIAENYRRTKDTQSTQGTQAKPSTEGAKTDAAAPAASSVAPPPAASPTNTPPSATTTAAAATPTTPAAAPPCKDPGPYVALAEQAKVGVADAVPVPAAGKPPTAGEAKK